MGGSDRCDVKSAAIFVIGLTAGTFCTIASKMLFEQSGIGKTGEVEPFKPALFQTWLMFFGMCFAFPLHFFFEYLRGIRARTDPIEQAKMDAEPAITMRTYGLLAIPSLFDLASASLLILALMNIDASIWMLLRGGCIVFVAVMKRFVLLDHLTNQMWTGIFVIAVGVVMVGMSSGIGHKEATVKKDVNVTFGLICCFFGTLMQSVQYCYEEKVMKSETAAPPWLLIGVEGITGTLICTLILYPLAWFLPGSDHGSYEDPINTISLLRSNPQALLLAVVYCSLVFILNSFSVLVTLMLSSVWHAILDNFRPVTIWAFELFLFYGLSSGQHGEEWTVGSWIQLGGMGVLIIGTAIYNGSIKVPGLKRETLLAAASPMATSALSRSPLLSRDPIFTPTSPYASGSREPFADAIDRKSVV